MQLEEAIQQIKVSRIFQKMTVEEIKQAFTCSNARIREYNKGEFVFYQGDKPEYMHILINGCITIGKETLSGHNTVLVKVNQCGELFGEIYLFLEQNYETFALAERDSTVIEFPAGYLKHRCFNACSFHEQLSNNLVTIFAKKAFYLNRKLQLLSTKSLRQRLITYLFQLGIKDNRIKLTMTREQMADYLNVTRPSLSRELSNLQEEGIIVAKKHEIQIVNQDLFLEYLD